MHLPSIFTTATLIATASAIRVSYDTGYDDAGRSLNFVSCSDGVNGLKTRYNWQTQGNIPGFSNIGGAQVISGWNSVNCGTCWKLQYKSNTIFVLAIDHTDTGFNIAKGALDRLTNNHAVEFGWVDATATQVEVKNCGITVPH